jgi:hypothetical protein
MNIAIIIKLLALGLGAYGLLMLLKLKKQSYYVAQKDHDLVVVSYFNIIVCVLAILCIVMLL